MRFVRLSLIYALCLGLILAVPAMAEEQGSSQSRQDMGSQGAGGMAPGTEQPSGQPEGGAGSMAPGGASEQGGAAAGPGAQPAGPMNEVEGKVNNVNPQSQTLKVGGFAGLFGTNLQVTNETRFIPAPGEQSASLSTLKEGDRVRVSYRKVDGQNIVSEITVLSSAGGQAPSGAPQPSQGGMAPESGQQQPPASEQAPAKSPSGSAY